MRMRIWSLSLRMRKTLLHRYRACNCHCSLAACKVLSYLPCLLVSSRILQVWSDPACKYILMMAAPSHLALG